MFVLRVEQRVQYSDCFMLVARVNVVHRADTSLIMMLNEWPLASTVPQDILVLTLRFCVVLCYPRASN